MNSTADNATVFVINPGSTTTQLALFDREHELWRESIHHPARELSSLVIEQLDLRWTAVETNLSRIPGNSLAAVVGRGGPLKSLPGGTYTVNSSMLDDYTSASYANHASNLGAVLAHKVAQLLQVPAYIVDPVTTDEFDPEARISGVPEIQRRCRSHALNIKAVARRTAQQLNQDLGQSRFVVAHMGGGISVAALRNGRIVDVNDALLGMGPFSAERAGALPLEGLLNLAFSGKYTFESLTHKLSRESGLIGYLGTNDLMRIIGMLEDGDELAVNVYRALVIQVAKEIAAMAAVLEGQLDAIILSGGMAHAERFTADLTDKVAFLAPVTIVPGSLEMEALARGAWRVLLGEETAREYA
jgi:butyrate kinase